MQSVGLNTTLFYRFLGFDREGFINAANAAQRRARQLQNKPNADLEPPSRKANLPQGTAQIPLVSKSLSVPRAPRLSRLPAEQQFTPPLPNYQQFTPSLVWVSPTSVDIYA